VPLAADASAWAGVTVKRASGKGKDSQTVSSGFVSISSMVIIGGTQHCTDTCGWQILNQMSGVGLW